MSDDTAPPPKSGDGNPIIRPQRIDRKLRATIIHEAGHVLACLVLRVKFVGADIRADNGSLGRVEVDFAAVPIDKQIIILMAGSAAERIMMPRGRTVADWGSSRNDVDESTALVAALNPDWSEYQTTSYLATMRRRAESIIRLHRATLLVIAERLSERGKIGNGDVAELWKGDDGG